MFRGLANARVDLFFLFFDPTSQVAQWLRLPTNAGNTKDTVQSLGWENPLEEEMATHSSSLAWRIPWTEEPGGLWSMGSQRVGHNCACMCAQATCKILVRRKGIKPGPPAVEMWNPNHWTARELLQFPHWHAVTEFGNDFHQWCCKCWNSHAHPRKQKKACDVRRRDAGYSSKPLSWMTVFTWQTEALRSWVCPSRIPS